MAVKAAVMRQMIQKKTTDFKQISSFLPDNSLEKYLMYIGSYVSPRSPGRLRRIFPLLRSVRFLRAEP